MISKIAKAKARTVNKSIRKGVDIEVRKRQVDNKAERAVSAQETTLDANSPCRGTAVADR